MRLTCNPDCTACPLHEAAQCVCIPMHLDGGPPIVDSANVAGVSPAPSPVSGSRPHALYVLGQNPGAREDAVGRNFMGWSGDCLRNVYFPPEDITRGVDVYLANAVRCFVTPGATVPQKSIKACRNYTLHDLESLCAQYEGRVTVLCLGAVAVKSLLGLSLRKAMAQQGALFAVKYQLHAVNRLARLPVISTYHPAVLAGGRADRSARTSLLEAVGSHMGLLRRTLDGDDITAAWVPGERIETLTLPPEDLTFLSLDVETYGKVSSYPEQTMFHPAKMAAVDGVPIGKQLQTVALTFRNAMGEMSSRIIPWTTEGARNLAAWLMVLKRNKGTLLGQNVVFDIQVLRANWPLGRILLTEPIRLWDLAITNALDDPERPEKSLKALSVVLGMGAYTEAPGDRHPNRFDEDLGKYNMEDTEKALRDHEVLVERVGGLTDDQYEFFSDVLWTLVEMSEAGTAIDVGAMTKYDALLDQGLKRIVGDAKPLVISGKGSMGSIRGLLSECYELVGEVPLLTDKVAAISTSREQIERCLGFMPEGHHDLRLALRRVETFGRLQKIRSSYTRPLLYGGKQVHQMAARHVRGTVYPTWYPVPTTEKDEAGPVGGTQQGRVAARSPSTPTWPKKIKSFARSRFPGGRLAVADYTQIELYVAALLSNDARMIADFEVGMDRHMATAGLLVTSGCLTQAEFDQKPRVWRVIGKTINFAVLYKCGADKLLEIILEATGMLLKRDAMVAILEGFAERHKGFITWQNEWVETVVAQGWAKLPITGHIRRFPGGAAVVRGAYTNEICNMIVQGPAACIALSGQGSVRREIRAKKMTTRLIQNTYDSITADVPRVERRRMAAIWPLLANPPCYQKLCALLGRTLVLKYEVTEGEPRA